MLSPIVFFLGVTTILNTFQSFDIIQVMTKGGPVDATNTLIYYVYQQGFVAFNAGRSSAAALVLFLLMLGITLVQVRYAERKGALWLKWLCSRGPGSAARACRWSRVAGYAAMAMAVIVIGMPLFWMLSGRSRPPRKSSLSPHLAAVQSPLEQLRRRLACGAVRPLLHQQPDHHDRRHGDQNGQRRLYAYALVFLRFPRKNLIFLVILAGLMVPEQVTILPNYVTLSDVFGQSWINTYQGIILPGAAIAFGTFLLRQTFRGLPREVIEAARVDGCSHLRLLWDMVIPMARSS